MATSEACPRWVLVVEDDEDIQFALSDVLEVWGYRAQVAGNGREALDRLRDGTCRPCLILLDIMMPVMDGWQFRTEQLADPGLADLPVVVLSAHASVVAGTARMPVTAMLPKPVQLDTLVELLARYC